MGQRYQVLDGWTSSLLLPTSGRWRWKVVIDKCFASCGCVIIGVCDPEATCGWGLCE